MFVAWPLLLPRVLLLSPILLVKSEPKPAVLQAALVAVELKAHN